MALSANRDFKQIRFFLASKWCFGLVLALFVAEALWIALSGRYPMAFDENFHLGIIRLYADHISPFWAAQPAGADNFGAIVRDPSYLYHWLMSFPYRLSDNVLFLRFINIGLFAWGIYLYRQLLLKTGASRALVHLCLAAFVLIPVVPLLAAQVNYDNLFFPLTALSLMLTLAFSDKLRQNRFDIKLFLGLITLVSLTCLVKYAFLPIAVVVVAYLLVMLWRVRSGLKMVPASKATGVVLAVLLILSLGLFTQRYGVNMARYHKPVPDCAAVLSVQRCGAYSPWARDYKHAQAKPAGATSSPLVFTADWLYGMWLRSFFAVDGPGTSFQTRGPLVLPGIGAIVVSVTALIATIAASKRVWQRYNRSALGLFIGVIVIYAGALWLDGYQSFLQTGDAVAINGRYLVPVLPLLIVILALGVNTLLDRRQGLKLAFGAVTLICLLWGGGALTYVLRSNPAWYWPNSPLTGANQTIQRNVGPLVPGYRTPGQFMSRN